MKKHIVMITLLTTTLIVASGKPERDPELLKKLQANKSNFKKDRTGSLRKEQNRSNKYRKPLSVPYGDYSDNLSLEEYVEEKLSKMTTQERSITSKAKMEELVAQSFVKATKKLGITNDSPNKK